MTRRMLSLLLSSAALAQQPAPITAAAVIHQAEGKMLDYPVLCTDSAGIQWTAFLQWDGKEDQLLVARADATHAAVDVGKPGIIHQPALAADGSGGLVLVWSQVNERDLMDLHAVRLSGGKPAGEITLLAHSAGGGNTHARAAMDREGRVWVTWQSMRGGCADVFCRWMGADGAWSKEVQISNDPMGDWEPTVAFDDKPGAWVIYDSSRGNEFGVYASRVGLDGVVSAAKTLLQTERFEGRVSAASSADGKNIWLSCERGRMRWGLDIRAHGGEDGLNGQKTLVLAKWDLIADTITEAPDPQTLINGTASLALVQPRSNNPAKAKGKGKANPKAKTQPKAKAETPEQAEAKGKVAARAASRSINLPQVALDAQGRPWVAVRYFSGFAWRMIVLRYDEAAKQWTTPAIVPDSIYCQDRIAAWSADKTGALSLAWPTDLRSTKLQKFTQVHIAKLNLDAAGPLSDVVTPAFRNPPAYINPVTPERPRDQRHSITHNGVTYHLYWGDYHRHTDFSNCITGNDGCIQEQFRYAIDMGKLDTLGTSDHTDIAKIYHPYEWWQNQKLVDVFYAPGFFTSMYAYEREQKWPHGHRNMVFAQRGGPIVYIQRANYLASPWQATLPVAKDGAAELSPQELWDVLVRYGKPVTAISHTGATGMGTDWNLFDSIDHRVENVIEIFQGARVSYEAAGAPQPTVGLREGETYNHSSNVIGKPVVGQPIRSFTTLNNGTYQNALSHGLKLGVWADSDHISTHTSYGGVYVKEFTREGIIEALNARRTIAATDKIFVDFTCNDQLFGSESASLNGKAVIKFNVNGTAKLKRLTLVRNEQDLQSWEPQTSAHSQSFTDESMLPGESRYYLRVEQEDGNMAWSSPVWVKKE
jgi:hypothetical protein